MGCTSSFEIINDYKIINKKLGSGGFGEVFLVANINDDKEEYAMKKIKIENNELDTFHSEVENLKKFNHNNIVKYID